MHLPCEISISADSHGPAPAASASPGLPSLGRAGLGLSSLEVQVGEAGDEGIAGAQSDVKVQTGGVPPSLVSSLRRRAAVGMSMLPLTEAEEEAVGCHAQDLSPQRMVLPVFPFPLRVPYLQSTSNLQVEQTRL